MTSYRIALITDAGAAKTLWDSFSPRQTIYDEWDFRWAFFQAHPGLHPHFIVAYHGEEPVALLPLQRPASGPIEFMGGDFMEDNRVFVKPGHASALPELLKAVPAPATLRSILDDGSGFLAGTPLDFPKYSYDLRGTKTLDDFLVRHFSSKRRLSRRKVIAAIEKLDLSVELNRLDDLEHLRTYNIDTFGDESVFRSNPAIFEVFKQLCALPYRHLIHSFVIGGKVQAVSLSLVHRDTYLFVLSGTNKNEISDLGSYLILKNIQTAIELGCARLDAGRHDCNWKERWHLQPTQEHRIDLPPIQA